MKTHPVTHSQQHSDSIPDTKYWETILLDAGLPPEPPQHHQTSPLPSDSCDDFGDQTRFFDKHSSEIFEAKQQWKKTGALRLLCDFCKCVFWDRKGTKFCTDNCRKRSNEGKTYVKVMCEGEDCDREIWSWQEPYVFEGKKRCSICEWFIKRGWKSYADYKRFCEEAEVTTDE